MKRMVCQFWITAWVHAWLWRRRGFDTMMGRVKHLNADGTMDMGYYVSGVNRK